MFVEPDRALPRSSVVAQLVAQHVRALAGVDALIEPAEPPRRISEQVESLGFDRGITAVGAGLDKRVETRLPVLSRSGLSALDEVIHS